MEYFIIIIILNYIIIIGKFEFCLIECEVIYKAICLVVLRYNYAKTTSFHWTLLSMKNLVTAEIAARKVVEVITKI